MSALTLQTDNPRFRVHALEGLGFSVPSFDELCRQHPDIAIKLLQALGRELSVRIRHANMTTSNWRRETVMAALVPCCIAE